MRNPFAGMSPPNRSCHGRRSTRNSGFALVVTLSLMVLLTLLALGLLTLSSVSLRQSSSFRAGEEARQNARLSVQLALGQLQSLTGQDTRVTASARLPDASNPQITGVWRSWEGGDHDSTGKPIAPDYASKRVAGTPAAVPGAAGNGRFLGWPTSTAANAAPDVAGIPDVSKTSSADSVPMVSDGSVPQGEDGGVFMKPTLLNGARGAIAWWTSGDNSKAMINADHAAKPASAVAWQSRSRQWEAGRRDIRPGKCQHARARHIPSKQRQPATRRTDTGSQENP